MRDSIRTRLLVFVIAIAVLPLVLVSVFANPQAYSTESQQAQVLQTQIAGRESSQFVDFFQNVQTQLDTVIHASPLLDSSVAQQQIILSGLLSQQPAFDRLFLLDDKGKEQVGVSRNFAIATSDLVSRAQADEFVIPSTQNKTYYSPVHTDATNRSWPASTPRLKVNSATGTSVCGSPVSFSAPAKPKPCSRPKANATTQG